MQQEEILTEYINEMSKIKIQFPLDSDSLNQNHKSILTKLFPSQSKSTLPTNIKKQLESEFQKVQSENEEKYINELRSYLDKEYSEIN